MNKERSPVPQSFDSIQFSFRAGELSPAFRARSDQAFYQAGIAEGWNFLVTQDGTLRTRPGTQWLRDFPSAGVRLKRFFANRARDGEDFLLVFQNTRLEIFQNRELFQTIEGADYPFTTGKLPQMRFDQNQNTMTVLHPDQTSPWELIFHEEGEFELVQAPLETVLPPPANLQADIRTAYTEDAEEAIEAVYVVTSVASNGEESSGGPPLHLTDLDPELSVVLFWEGVPSARAYNIYRSDVGKNLFGSAPTKLIASNVVTPFFTDSNIEAIDISPPDYTDLIIPGAVVDVEMIANGEGYSSNTRVFIDPSVRGSGASFQPYINAEGAIEAIQPVEVGQGYDNPSLVIEDENGAGAQARAITRPLAGTTPNAIAYYQQRRLFAGTYDDPLHIWGSAVGNYRLFSLRSVPTLSSPFSEIINSREQNPIRHLIAVPSGLFVFSAEGVWRLYGQPFGPGNLNIDPLLYDGASEVPPLVIRGSVFYLENEQQTVRALRQEGDAEVYQGGDVSALSSHLFARDNDVVSWTYQFPYLWAVRRDGTLLCLTYNEERQIIAWTKHRSDHRNGRNLSRFLQVEATSDGIYVLMAREFEETHDPTEVGPLVLLGNGCPLLFEDRAMAVLSDPTSDVVSPESSNVLLRVNSDSLLEVGEGSRLIVDTRNRLESIIGQVSLEYLSFDEIEDPLTWATLDSWRHGDEVGKLEVLAGDPAYVSYGAARHGIEVKAEALMLPIRNLETPTGQLRLGLNKIGQIYHIDFLARGGVPNIAANNIWRQTPTGTARNENAEGYTPLTYIRATDGTQSSRLSIAPGGALDNTQVLIRNTGSEPLELFGYSFEVSTDPQAQRVSI